MRLNHNINSLRIYNQYKVTLTDASKAINNITSGKKVGSAKDNPNKIETIENLDFQIKARDAVSQNVQDTNSMLQTFDGALQEVNNNIARLKELTVQAANGTYDDKDLAVINKEIDGVKNTINDLCKNTTFNGKALTSSNPLADMSNPEQKQATIGALPDEKTYISFYNLVDIMDLDSIDIGADPEKAIETVDNAIINISKIRSRYGALQSRLENTYATSDEVSEVYTRAVSSFEDADIAEEMMNYARTQILYQSSLGLMAQSNKLPQDALNVLASVR